MITKNKKDLNFYITVFHILVIIALCFTSQQAQATKAPEKVSIQFKWFHQFQFAGYYAALEKGFYAEEGLDVELIERDPSIGHIDQVLNGKSEYGVADAGLVLYRQQGKPVVLIAQIFQHSPLALLARQDSGIRTPCDLVGKTIMADMMNNSDAPVYGMLLKTLGSLDKVNVVPHTYRNEDLLEGKVDSMDSYLTDQPFWFNKRGVNINIIDPRDYGVDFYGDNLFTTEAEIRDHPTRVDKIIRATKRGWRYALRHQEEIVDLILEKYDNRDLDREHLLFESLQTKNVILPDVVELGSYEPSRFSKMAEIYTLLGFAESSKVDEQFYYQSVKSQIDLTTDELLWLKTHRKIRLAIKNSWLGITVKFGTDLKTILKWSAPFLLAIIIVIVFVVTWNRKLSCDVAKRKLAEEGLRKLTRAVENGPMAIIITDLQGTIEYVNPKFTHMTGFESGEAIGHNPRIFSSGQHPQEFYKEVWKTILAGKEWHGEFLNKAKTGELQWQSALIAPIIDENKEVTHFVSIQEDVTEKNMVAKELQKLSWAIEHSPVSVVITDLEGTIEYVNPCFCKTSGYTQEEAIGQNPQILNSGKHSPEFFKELWDTIKSGQVWNGEIANKRKNGTIYWENSTISPILDETGQIISFEAVKEDITERKRLRTEMRQNLDDLERFSSMAIDREEKMIELKEEINQLLEQAGQKEKYTIVK
ncbi:MAG: ABC transporter substrate-binding protein [Desulfobulbaceae bacterium]|nr:ABC transporter substrate-binding protein [Desulfobulbaceae bacterium]